MRMATSGENRLTAREAAEHIRWGLEHGDEDFAIRYVTQAISDFRAMSPESRETFLDAPPTTGDTRYDTLLATAIAWECNQLGLTPPEWTKKPPLQKDWIVWPSGSPSKAWADRIRLRTPTQFAEKRIFVTANDFTTA